MKPSSSPSKVSLTSLSFIDSSLDGMTSHSITIINRNYSSCRRGIVSALALPLLITRGISSMKGEIVIMFIIEIVVKAISFTNHFDIGTKLVPSLSLGERCLV